MNVKPRVRHAFHVESGVVAFYTYIPDFWFKVGAVSIYHNADSTLICSHP